MTYITYILLCLTLHMAAAELDRHIGLTLYDRWLGGLPGPFPWYASPAASLALPGAGQLLNRQPVKAAAALLGAIAIAAVPRPQQLVAVTWVWLLLPWYILIVADALVCGLMRRDPVDDYLDWDEDDPM